MSDFVSMWSPLSKPFQRSAFLPGSESVEIIEGMEIDESGDPGVISLKGRRKFQSRAVWEPEREPSMEEEREDSGGEVLDKRKESIASEVNEVEVKPAKEVPVKAKPSHKPSTGNPPASPVLKAAEMLEQAADLLEEPVLSLEQIVELAREEAIAETRESMRIEMEEMKQSFDEMKSAHESLGPLVEELSGLKRKIYQESAQDVADLALHVARRVVGETLAVHPESLITLCENALSRLPGDDEVRIRLRPDDIAVVEGHLPTRRSIRLIPDESLDGGCVVEAQCGEVEASLEAAFVGLRQAVSEWLEDQKA